MSRKRDVVYWVERLDEELRGGRKLTGEEIEEALAYKFEWPLSSEQEKMLEKLRAEFMKMKKENK